MTAPSAVPVRTMLQAISAMPSAGAILPSAVSNASVNDVPQSCSGINTVSTPVAAQSCANRVEYTNWGTIPPRELSTLRIRSEPPKVNHRLEGGVSYALNARPPLSFQVGNGPQMIPSCLKVAGRSQCDRDKR